MGVLTQSAQEFFNYQKVIRYNDFTETTSGTAETISLFTIPSDAVVMAVSYGLVTEFTGGSLATLTVKLGDEDDDDGFTAAASILTGATPLSSKINTGAYFNDGTTANTINGKVYDNASTKTVKAVFTPGSDALTAATAGEIVIKAKILNLKQEL